MLHVYRHPLREDVSWNILILFSSKNWTGHPLREDVSWNIIDFPMIKWTDGHPLREDVSWNVRNVALKFPMRVILFVRMWVEILKNTVLIIVVAIWFFLWRGELKYPWSSFSASHEGVTIIHYLIWILNSIIEISEEIFTCVPRKNEQHLVVSLIFIWYLNAG